jgi:hypothetical protein
MSLFILDDLLQIKLFFWIMAYNLAVTTYHLSNSTYMLTVCLYTF